MSMKKQTKKSIPKIRRPNETQELDSVYLMKLVLYLIIGAQWVYFTRGNNSQIPLPIGLIIGLAFAVHDHFRIDRRIEFAVLIIAMFVGFWSQVGITINV